MQYPSGSTYGRHSNVNEPYSIIYHFLSLGANLILWYFRDDGVHNEIQKIPRNNGNREMNQNYSEDLVNRRKMKLCNDDVISAVCRFITSFSKDVVSCIPSLEKDAE